MSAWYTVHIGYYTYYILRTQYGNYTLNYKRQSETALYMFLLSLANYSKKRSGQNGPLTNTSKDKV